ncbi:hypothetical protein PVMG_05635 [Plasmodium vivax Mauritania I]|uniref:Uncharacterized protein n=2 Tax=Plasmodium vivax TaxID=5855 RepID=A0A0J9TIS3_PLAVI|nr:hypothetical protein PVBG_05675 [Plasmodium vivax Brazil I]KMZ94966.1 hypothetical protein PVMG_05635 [Plasmodium vivax Mauritania I]
MVTQPGESRFRIKELPSEIFYEWLDSYLISASNYYSDCITLKDIYKENYRIKGLCARVAKYIKTKPSISNREHLKDHHCNLFNYWIYEKLIRYYGDSSSVPFHVFGDFLRVLSGLKYYLNDNKCKLNDSIIINPYRKERKELYEYCIDYKTILEKFKNSKDQCNFYYTYVKKKIPSYKKVQELCSLSDKTKCPDFYEKCEPHNPTVLLDQLNCDSIGVEEKQQHKGDPGTTSNSSPSIESVSKFGHAFLGVVVASMSSGFLYKVNTNLIKIHG